MRSRSEAENSQIHFAERAGNPVQRFDNRRRIMECRSCGNEITPGLEIIIDELSGGDVHCPYCLRALNPGSGSPEGNGDCPGQRAEMRRKVREQFMERLAARSGNGEVPCPFCSHPLNRNERRRLLEEDHYRCSVCGRDLAVQACREDAYHAQRWLPVIYALDDLLQDDGCRSCSHIRVIARACQKALSWMPGTEMGLHGRVSGILRRARWDTPDCDPESCVAVRQYRKLAGEGLLLL